MPEFDPVALLCLLQACTCTGTKQFPPQSLNISDKKDPQHTTCVHITYLRASSTVLNALNVSDHSQKEALNVPSQPYSLISLLAASMPKAIKTDLGMFTKLKMLWPMCRTSSYMACTQYPVLVSDSLASSDHGQRHMR